MCVFKIFYHKSNVPSNQSNCKHFIYLKHSRATKDGAATTSQVLFNKIIAFSEW